MDSLQFHEFEQRGWQAVAHRYADSWARVTTQAIGALLDAAGVRQNTRVLDIACGPGFVAAAAAGRGASALGIDFSPAMLAEARRRYPAVEFREGDATHLEFADATFDAVVSNFGVLHLAEPERALAEAGRVLLRGGRFAFTVWDMPDKAEAHGIVLRAVQTYGNMNVPIPAGPPFFRFSDPAEAKRTLTAAGFANPSVTRVPQLWRLEAPDELFDIMYNSSVRNSALLKAQAPNALEDIRSAIRRDVEAHHCVLAMPAVLVSAERAVSVEPRPPDGRGAPA